MSSLSRDWVWMAVPKEEGGVGDTPYTPAPSIHLAKTPFSFRNPLNVLNAMAIFLWAAAAQTAVRVHQSIVPADAALCICGVSLSAQGGEGEREGERGISSSSILSSTSTPFRQHVRIYFFHLPAMNTRLIRLLCAPLSFPFSAMIERELSFTI